MYTLDSVPNGWSSYRVTGDYTHRIRAERLLRRYLSSVDWRQPRSRGRLVYSSGSWFGVVYHPPT